MDDKVIAGTTVGTILGVAGTGLSVTELQQIISMACTIVGLLITVITAVVIPVWKELREAKKDGKITPEEMEDIAKTTKDGIDKIQDEINNKEEGDQK